MITIKTEGIWPPEGICSSQAYVDGSDNKSAAQPLEGVKVGVTMQNNALNLVKI